MGLRRIKPLVPAGAEYDRSRQFYEDLGFVANWEHAGLAELECEGVAFILQESGLPAARDLVIHLEVDDLDAWWRHIEDSGVLKAYEGVSGKPPTDYPWGGREAELVDPAGVCWHFV